MTNPTTPEHGTESPAGAMRLLHAFGAAGWSVERHDDLRYWSAERAIGRQIRYLCAATAMELAGLIEAAGAPPLDSEPWTCAGCGGQMIGSRVPDDLCNSCVVRALAGGAR